MSRVKKISSILLKVVFIGIAVILIYMPIVVIALQSFNGSKNNEIFTEFSSKWYGGLFYPEGFLEGNDVQNASDLQEAIVNTLMVTTLSTIISTILGVIFAIGIHSLSRKKRQRMILLNNVPIINADIVTGVTLMIVFSIIFSELGFTSLLLSHIFFCIPYVVLSVLPKLSEIDNNLYDAAVDLGCNSVKAIWKVILPAIKSGIIMGMLLAFTMSIDDFTILIERFINKYQQNYFDSPSAFMDEAEKIEDDKTKTYYRLGYKVYQRYIEILKSKNNEGEFALFNNFNYDFNQVIYECAKRIRAGYLDDRISQLKWILIDEYQDFSRLFDFLIESILQRNNSIKLFCVGDDWQAINRFAGSDLKYFNNFVARYKNAKTFNIRTNYRCDNNIVLFANKFMEKCGLAGKAQRSFLNASGIVKEIDISKIFIEDISDESLYFKHLNKREYNLYEKVRYLIACTNIIKNNKNKKIFILNRGNQILGKELEEFGRVLKRICLTFMTEEEYINNIFVKTVHKSKGEEADIVILLNVNQGVFPVYNPNNDLFQIFGYSTIDTVEDEERLYYVALTRAKHELYVLYEESIKSSFIIANE